MESPGRLHNVADLGATTHTTQGLPALHFPVIYG